jgi:hypothetical protein
MSRPHQSPGRMKIVAAERDRSSREISCCFSSGQEPCIINADDPWAIGRNMPQGVGSDAGIASRNSPEVYRYPPPDSRNARDVSRSVSGVSRNVSGVSDDGPAVYEFTSEPKCLPRRVSRSGLEVSRNGVLVSKEVGGVSGNLRRVSRHICTRSTPAVRISAGLRRLPAYPQRLCRNSGRIAGNVE